MQNDQPQQPTLTSTVQPIKRTEPIDPEEVNELMAEAQRLRRVIQFKQTEPDLSISPQERQQDIEALLETAQAHEDLAKRFMAELQGQSSATTAVPDQPVVAQTTPPGLQQLQSLPKVPTVQNKPWVPVMPQPSKVVTPSTAPVTATPTAEPAQQSESQESIVWQR